MITGITTNEYAGGFLVDDNLVHLFFFNFGQFAFGTGSQQTIDRIATNGFLAGFLVDEVTALRRHPDTNRWEAPQQLHNLLEQENQDVI